MQKRAFYGSLFVILFGLCLVGVSLLAREPDFELKFNREVSSELDQKTLGEVLAHVDQWPKWFFYLTEAKLQSGNLGVGARVLLMMDPQKGPWKKFQILVEVTRFIPNQEITFRVLDGSNGKIARLFDRVDWDIRLKPTTHGTMIDGEETAHTSHWRSRLAGRVSGQILMNQLFYPDLIRLANMGKPELENPLSD